MGAMAEAPASLPSADVCPSRYRPWINPDGAPRDEVVKTVSTCPSGALSYSVDGKEYRDRGGAPRILIAPHGPYAIGGGADLEGVELLEGGTLDHFDLCRCGKSKNKPFLQRGALVCPDLSALR